VDQISAGVAREADEKVTEFLARIIKSVVQKFLQTMTAGKFGVRGVSMSALYFGATNGVSDLAQFFAALHYGKQNESEKDLAKDKTFQILQEVMAVVQAIVMMAAGFGMNAGASNEESAGQSILDAIFSKLKGITAIANKMDSLEGFLNNSAVLLGSRALQGLGDGLNMTGMSLQANNDATQSHLTKDMGEAEAAIFVGKALQEMYKMYEGKAVESFAAVIQQEVTSLIITLNKVAEAQKEAARLLIETSV
jgi:hypothetical protein